MHDEQVIDDHVACFVPIAAFVQSNAMQNAKEKRQERVPLKDSAIDIDGSGCEDSFVVVEFEGCLSFHHIGSHKGYHDW